MCEIIMFRKRMKRYTIPNEKYKSDPGHYEKVSVQMDNLFITLNNDVFNNYPHYKPEPGEDGLILLKDFTLVYNHHGRPISINWAQRPNVSKPIYDFDPYFLKYVNQTLKKVFKVYY